MPQHQTRQQTLNGLAKRALTHLQNHTTDLADDVMPMPVSAYTNPTRYDHEIDRIFKNLPLALALSLELPHAGSYRAMNVVGVPVLITRDEDGVARAFLNICRHRGAPVCEPGTGNSRVFACPYHAWTYNHQGELIGRYAPETFGDIEHDQYSLHQLPCAERSGLIWVALNPHAEFQIDSWLGDFAAELDTLNLSDWHLAEQRELPGPGWKITLDGYLEAYHHNFVHTSTVGKHTIGNLLVLDTYGPHQRLVFGRKTLPELADVDEPNWQGGKHIRLIHSGFPNLSISGILGDHCLVSQIFPGPTPNSTITRQSILAAEAPTTKAQKQTTQDFSQMVLQAVRDEDYAIGMKIQSGISSGSAQSFIYGRNEPAVQNYHHWVEKLSQ